MPKRWCGLACRHPRRHRILGLADVKARLDQLGLEVQGGTPESLDAFIKSEVAKIERLIKAGLLKPE
jgi:tripartite-type tricarboxylate transporter receptor subunit TctC